MERLRARLRSADRRTLVLVAAPAVAAIAAAAVFLPVLTSGGPSPVTDAPAAERAAAPPAQRGPALEAPADSAQGAAPQVAPAPVPGGGGRARQVTAWTRVRVEGVDALSRASSRAMAVVRGLGGFTASSDYDVPTGAQGTNRLVFRVPVARANEAIAAFGRLGTVTGQRADVVDVTARIDAAGRLIDRLESDVERLRAELAARPDDELRGQLARAEARLRAAEGRRAADLSRARLATLNLTLTTRGRRRPRPTRAVSAGHWRAPASASRTLRRGSWRPRC